MLITSPLDLLCASLDQYWFMVCLPAFVINPMKTLTTYNSQPLLRDFAALLLAAVVAALCLTPVTGRAQIFVTNEGNNTIGEYNSTTGATINSSFISSVLITPRRIAFAGEHPV